jgi:excisionase family DNA binding protein
MVRQRNEMTTNPNQGGEPAAALGAFEPYISKIEVARRLGKRTRTIDHWMQRGLLPYYKIGRSVAFKWSEVELQLRWG